MTAAVGHSVVMKVDGHPTFLTMFQMIPQPVTACLSSLMVIMGIFGTDGGSPF